MSSPDTRNRNVLLDRRQQEQAQTLLSAVGPEFSAISVGSTHELIAVPPELATVLREIVSSMAAGTRVSIAALPEELTTTVAADQLGISRPTLMKMIRDGEIAAHKVGSHYRVRAEDVVEFKRRRLQRQRDAFAALQELDEVLNEF